MSRTRPCARVALLLAGALLREPLERLGAGDAPEEQGGEHADAGHLRVALLDAAQEEEGQHVGGDEAATRDCAAPPPFRTNNLVLCS